MRRRQTEGGQGRSVTGLAIFFPHSFLPREVSLSVQNYFLNWPVSRRAAWADCFYTGQCPDVQNPHAIKCGGGGEQAGGRVSVGVKGEDVAEERLGSIDVVGCGGWQMEEAACEGAYGCCRHVGRPP